MKKIIAKIYKWSTATRWDENLMLPLYIRMLFYINVYIAVFSLFPDLVFYKVLGILSLIILFFAKILLIKYGRKFSEELKIKLKKGRYNEC
jgi:hypothetical protein